MNENIKHAIGRLKTALKYGPDMESSKNLCFTDAYSLLAALSYSQGD